MRFVAVWHLKLSSISADERSYLLWNLWAYSILLKGSGLRGEANLFFHTAEKYQFWSVTRPPNSSKPYYGVSVPTTKSHYEWFGIEDNTACCRYQHSVNLIPNATQIMLSSFHLNPITWWGQKENTLIHHLAKSEEGFVHWSYFLPPPTSVLWKC